MDTVVSGTDALVSCKQPANALSPITTAFLFAASKLTEVRYTQPLNALAPISVTLAPRTTEVILLLPLNTEAPILVMLSQGSLVRSPS